MPSCAIPINKYFDVVNAPRCMCSLLVHVNLVINILKIYIICQYFARSRKWYKRTWVRWKKKNCSNCHYFTFNYSWEIILQIARRKTEEEEKNRKRKAIVKHAHFVFMLYLFPWHVARILISSDVYYTFSVHKYILRRKEKKKSQWHDTSKSDALRWN